MRIDDFRKVTLDDRDMFRELYRKYPPEHSDYLHAVMASWSHYMDYRYAWIEDSLVLYTENEGKRRLRPPIGEFDAELIGKVTGLASKLGCNHPLSMIGERTAENLRRELPDLVLEEHRDYFDYIYTSDDLSDLPGKKFLNIRNYLNKFRRENDHQVEDIDGGNQEEVKEFLRRWCIQKGCNEDPFLLSERQATMTSLENLDELGLSGSVIRIGDTIEALSIYEEMRPDMAVVHYEKANFEIPGLYQAINNETALILRSKYRYINREADMGVPGLRKAKEKYRPSLFLKVHHVLG